MEFAQQPQGDPPGLAELVSLLRKLSVSKDDVQRQSDRLRERYRDNPDLCVLVIAALTTILRGYWRSIRLFEIEFKTYLENLFRAPLPPDWRDAPVSPPSPTRAWMIDAAQNSAGSLGPRTDDDAPGGLTSTMARAAQVAVEPPRMVEPAMSKAEESSARSMWAAGDPRDTAPKPGSVVPDTQSLGEPPSSNERDSTLASNSRINVTRPSPQTSLPDRVTHELPAGQLRTPEETSQARNFFKRNRSAAENWWVQRTGEKRWPAEASHAEHPRALKDGGDPLFIEPRYEGPNAPHMIPGPDGNSDFQRWGKMGGRPQKTP